jgi:hypothetical protein
MVPLRRIIGKLLAAGYDGFFEVELIGEEIEASDYHDLLHGSRQAFAAWTHPVGR